MGYAVISEDETETFENNTTIEEVIGYLQAMKKGETLLISKK